MKKIPISLLCGTATVVVTIVLYFLILGNIFLKAICLISLISVIISEIFTTVLAYLSNGAPRKVASAVVSAILIPFSIILSIVYIVNFPKGYGTYIAWYFAAFVAVGLFSVILFNFDFKKQAEDDALQTAKSNMLNMRKMVKCIIVEPVATEYRDLLNTVEEKLHFSNDSVIIPQDEQIFNMLIELQTNISNPEFNVLEKINEINKLIDTRNIIASRTV